jgi:hypothetical protein
MAGYSRTGTAKKLGVKTGSELVLYEAPDGWGVPDLPDGVIVRRIGPADSFVAPNSESVVIAFFRTMAAYTREIATLGKAIFPAGGLWVAWPRRAGGHESDITDKFALPIGLVDNKVAAIDEDWSGLRVVWRIELRKKPPEIAAEP